MLQLKSIFIAGTTACLLMTAPLPVLAQSIDRHIRVSKQNVTSMCSVDGDSVVVIVDNAKTPYLSTNSGLTFHQMMSYENATRLGESIACRSSERGTGFIIGEGGSDSLLRSSDGGLSWHSVSYGSTIPRLATGQFTAYNDGLCRFYSKVSSDSGRTWRRFFTPDTVAFTDFSQWPTGHAFGKGTLFRTDQPKRWYQVDHSTGAMSERRDIDSDATWAGSVSFNKTTMVKRKGLGSEIVNVDSAGAWSIITAFLGSNVSLDTFRFESFVNQQSAVILMASSPSPIVVVVTEGGVVGLDVVQQFPGYNSVTYLAGNDSTSVLRIGSNDRSKQRMIVRFDHHTGAIQSKLIPPLSDSPSGSAMLGRAVVQLKSGGVEVLDTDEGTVSRTGVSYDLDGVEIESERILEVLPIKNMVLAVDEALNIVSTDHTINERLSIQFRSLGSKQVKRLGIFETMKAAQRRYESMYGHSWLWTLSNGSAWHGGFGGLHQLNLSSGTSMKVLPDTVTSLWSTTDGNLFAAHRSLWISPNEGASWGRVTMPDTLSAISSIIDNEQSLFIGKRGLARTFNAEQLSALPGGLHQRDTNGAWNRVPGIGEYVYGLSRDMNGSLWVVSTNVTMNILGEVGTDTIVSQITLEQGDVYMHRSTDGGLNWSLMHSERATDVHRMISGVTTNDQSGRLVVAMPTRVLASNDKGQTWNEIDLFPFGTNFTSARFDDNGGLWVASTNGAWRIRFDSTTSVLSDNTTDRPCFVSVPNPTISTVTMFDQEREPAFGMFTVRDAEGSIVHMSAGPVINLSNLANGVYFLSPKEHADCSPVKILKQ